MLHVAGPYPLVSNTTGMTKTALVIPQREDVMGYIEAVNRFSQQWESITLVTPKDVEMANVLLTEVHTEEKALLAHKEELTRPIMDGLFQIREIFKTPELNLAALKKEMKAKILAYTVDQDEKAQAKQEKVLARVAKGTMRADTAIAKIEEAKAVPQANVRVVRKLEIYDLSLIPRIFLIADREAITRALFAGATVEGARLKEEKIIASGRI